MFGCCNSYSLISDLKYVSNVGVSCSVQNSTVGREPCFAQLEKKATSKKMNNNERIDLRSEAGESLSQNLGISESWRLVFFIARHGSSEVNANACANVEHLECTDAFEIKRERGPEFADDEFVARSCV